MVRRSKKSYALGMAIEATYNTYKAPTTYIRYTDFGVDVTPNDEDLDICDGVPGSKLMYRKDAEVGGDMNLPAWPEEGLEPLLKLIFGGATSAINGTGPSYKHTFTQDWDSILSASLTHWAPGLTAPDVEAYTGAVLKSLEIGYDGPGPITLKPTWECAGYDASKTAPTRTYSTAPIFTWGNFTCKIDQTLKTDVTKAALKIERSTDKLTGASGDPKTALIPDIITPTDWAVTGSLQFPYETKAYLMEYLSGSSSGTTLNTVIAEKKLELICTGPTIHDTHKYLMDFKMPLVNMSKCARDKNSDKTILYDIDFAARYYDGTDKGLGTDCILTGEVVSKLKSIV